MLERRRDGFPVIPLDFDHAVFDRPPTPARLFEVFCQGFVVVRGQLQVFDQRHHLAAAAFRGTMDEGGLLGRREGGPCGADGCRLRRSPCSVEYTRASLSMGIHSPFSGVLHKTCGLMQAAPHAVPLPLLSLRRLGQHMLSRHPPLQIASQDGRIKFGHILQK